MVCYRPQAAHQSWNYLNNSWGKVRINYPVFVAHDGARSWSYSPIGDFSNLKHRRQLVRNITVPCGVCFGCRIDNSRMWSLRMMHEKRYHDQNYFLTLTIAPEFMPPDCDLDYSYLIKFWKNARHLFQVPGRPFKYFACGEYGDKNFRPHFHAAVFDFDIPDLRFFKKVSDHDYFTSNALTECWGYGHVIVGSLEYDSAAYIARYVTKKMRGSNVRSKDTFDPETGEYDLYTVERAFQSKGLGLPFYLQHSREIWDLDACLYGGKYLVKPPRYYFKKLLESDPALASDILQRRLDKRVLEGTHFDRLDEERDRELLYQMEARRLHMSSLKRSL